MTIDQIYQENYGKVYSLCFQMLKNAADAEDLTQDTFVQVQKKLPQFRGDSSVSTWVYRVAKNTVLMYMRSRKIRPQCVATLDDPFFHPRTKDSPVERLAIQKALTKLPDGYKNYFVLREVYGFEYGEAAAAFGASDGTSKSQVFKAKKILKRVLKGN